MIYSENPDEPTMSSATHHLLAEESDTQTDNDEDSPTKHNDSGFAPEKSNISTDASMGNSYTIN